MKGRIVFERGRYGADQVIGASIEIEGQNGPEIKTSAADWDGSLIPNHIETLVHRASTGQWPAAVLHG